MRWSKINPDRATLPIDHSVTTGPADQLSLRPPKNGRGRSIALDPGTIAALVRHMWDQTSLARRRHTTLAVDPFLFSGRTAADRPWSPGTPTVGWLRLRESIGLEHVRLHDLRHYAVTMMLAGGIPVRTVADRVGHASPAMTLNVYGHAIPGQDQQAAELLGQLISAE